MPRTALLRLSAVLWCEDCCKGWAGCLSFLLGMLPTDMLKPSRQLRRCWLVPQHPYPAETAPTPWAPCCPCPAQRPMAGRCRPPQPMLCTAGRSLRSAHCSAHTPAQRGSRAGGLAVFLLASSLSLGRWPCLRPAHQVAILGCGIAFPLLYHSLQHSSCPQVLLLPAKKAATEAEA